MKRMLCAGLTILAAAFTVPACAQTPSSAPSPAAPAPQMNEADLREIEAVQKLLKGEPLDSPEIGRLEKALIRLETAAAKGGVDSGGGKEGPATEGPLPARSVYLLNFSTGAGDERDLRMLKMQREMLKNQLTVMRSLNAIADGQVGAGSRTARLESGTRDMTLGMKSSAAETRKLAGDAASTLAKVNDVDRITADMAMQMKEMQKTLEGIEHEIANMEAKTRKAAAAQASSADDAIRQMRKMNRALCR